MGRAPEGITLTALQDVVFHEERCFIAAALYDQVLFPDTAHPLLAKNPSSASWVVFPTKAGL